MAQLGRDVILNYGGAVIAGTQTKGMTLNNEPVDITNDSSDGWTTLFSEAGIRSVEIPISGILEDDALIAQFFSGTTQIAAGTLTFVDGIGALSGNFFLGSVSITGEHSGAVSFDATLMSSGIVTFTPAP